MPLLCIAYLQKARTYAHAHTNTRTCAYLQKARVYVTNPTETEPEGMKINPNLKGENEVQKAE
jgi:hypothetical protein